MLTLTLILTPTPRGGGSARPPDFPRRCGRRGAVPRSGTTSVAGGGGCSSSVAPRSIGKDPWEQWMMFHSRREVFSFYFSLLSFLVSKLYPAPAFHRRSPAMTLTPILPPQDGDFPPHFQGGGRANSTTYPTCFCFEKGGLTPPSLSFWDGHPGGRKICKHSQNYSQNYSFHFSVMFSPGFAKLAKLFPYFVFTYLFTCFLQDS